VNALRLAPRRAAHALIRFYQLTLSSLIGRQCRYLPSCSAYADEAILRHGLWAGVDASLALRALALSLRVSGESPSPQAPARGGFHRSLTMAWFREGAICLVCPW
jgi:putative membrane protein insertion efficiency factor